LLHPDGGKEKNNPRKKSIMSFIKKTWSHIVKHYLLVMILAFFLSPIFFFMFHPEKDFAFHVLKNEPTVITADTVTHIKDNTYVIIQGSVDPDSMVVTTEFLGTSLGSCTFRLKDFPKNLILFSRHGALFERLNLIYQSAEAPVPIKERILRFQDDSIPGSAIPLEILAHLNRQNSFQGRINSSSGNLLRRWQKRSIPIMKSVFY